MSAISSKDWSCSIWYLSHWWIKFSCCSRAIYLHQLQLSLNGCCQKCDMITASSQIHLNLLHTSGNQFFSLNFSSVSYQHLDIPDTTKNCEVLGVCKTTINFSTKQFNLQNPIKHFVYICMLLFCVLWLSSRLKWPLCILHHSIIETISQ